MERDKIVIELLKIYNLKCCICFIDIFLDKCENVSEKFDFFYFWGLVCDKV